MEREIKFQVLHQNKIIGIERLNGTQWEWQYFILNPDKEERWTSGVFGNSPNLIRRQYTGLKDKKGKDIYEGDICRVLYSDWSSKSESDIRTLEQYLIDISSILVCIYSVNGFYFSSTIGFEQSMEVGKHGNIEVIGNIYENPELLNK